MSRLVALKSKLVVVVVGRLVLNMETAMSRQVAVTLENTMCRQVVVDMEAPTL